MLTSAWVLKWKSWLFGLSFWPICLLARLNENIASGQSSSPSSTFSTSSSIYSKYAYNYFFCKIMDSFGPYLCYGSQFLTCAIAPLWSKEGYLSTSTKESMYLLIAPLWSKQGYLSTSTKKSMYLLAWLLQHYSFLPKNHLNTFPNFLYRKTSRR